MSETLVKPSLSTFAFPIREGAIMWAGTAMNNATASNYAAAVDAIRLIPVTFFDDVLIAYWRVNLTTAGAAGAKLEAALYQGQRDEYFKLYEFGQIATTTTGAKQWPFTRISDELGPWFIPRGHYMFAINSNDTNQLEALHPDSEFKHGADVGALTIPGVLAKAQAFGTFPASLTGLSLNSVHSPFIVCEFQKATLDDHVPGGAQHRDDDRMVVGPNNLIEKTASWAKSSGTAIPTIAQANFNILLNRRVGVPLFIPREMTFDAIVIERDQTGPGKKVHLGVYTHDADSFIALDAVVLTGEKTVSNGVNTFTFTNPIYARAGTWLWLVQMKDIDNSFDQTGAGATMMENRMRGSSGVSISPVNIKVAFFSGTGAFGALPSTDPIGVGTTSVLGPRLGLRVKHVLDDGVNIVKPPSPGEVHPVGLIATEAHYISGVFNTVIAKIKSTSNGGDLWASWYPVSRPQHVSKLRIYVDEVIAASVASLGIYATEEVGGYPGPLLRDLGTITTASTLGQTKTTDLWLNPPGVWLVIGSVKNVELGSRMVGSFQIGSDTAITGKCGGYRKTGQATLADPYPTGAASVQEWQVFQMEVDKIG